MGSPRWFCRPELTSRGRKTWVNSCTLKFVVKARCKQTLLLGYRQRRLYYYYFFFWRYVDMRAAINSLSGPGLMIRLHGVYAQCLGCRAGVREGLEPA